MVSITCKGIKVTLDDETLCYEFSKDSTVWRWREKYRPRIECEDGIVYFSDAKNIWHKQIRSGVGEGILSHYENFTLADGKTASYAFETLVWVESTTGHVYCEWMPVKEEGLKIKAVRWPGEMAFDEPKKTWYTLINEGQGLLIPNTWKNELGSIAFDGTFGTEGSYMPWYAQVKDRSGYLLIAVTPWNAGWKAEHPAGGPYTHIGVHMEPSLGKMDYRRVFRYTFLEDCDYNDICKEYRHYAKEKGLLKTLAEKAAKNPTIHDLIGCSVMHTGIKKSVQPESRFYDKAHPENNESLNTFAEREKEARTLHELGVKKLYMHLDGWGQPGDDNQHPDYTPACKEAGGWEGMKSLVDAMHEMGYLFGIHDQYRDYYFAAKTFDREYALQLPDGTMPQHHMWAGGEQTYLCATQAPYYVKRNFTILKDHGIDLDCAYLDVFTCNEGDECDNPHHRMTRKECYAYRNECFEYLLTNNILPSSEEANDWSMPSLVFSHYAPYNFMLKAPGTPKYGIPVPLFNLVFHDCLIIPWLMEKVSDNEDYMLYALINGGIPYLLRDGAYPGMDGAFSENQREKLIEDINRSKVVAELHERIAMQELSHHEILDDEGLVQKSSFADGTTVTVDFTKNTYEIIAD